MSDAHGMTHILIPIESVPSVHGEAIIQQLLIRVAPDDKAKVDAAASALGLSQQQYMRMVLIRASEKVLRETGVKTP